MLETFIHSILMSEVKDMESKVLQALEKLQTKKTLKFHLELNFNKLFST